jgi:hypothetical protein
MPNKRSLDTSGVLYRIKNIDGMVMVTDERADIGIVFPTICDASEDIEKRLGLKSDDEGGYLAYIPASKIRGFERYERRQRFFDSVRRAFDLKKYFLG